MPYAGRLALRRHDRRAARRRRPGCGSPTTTDRRTASTSCAPGVAATAATGSRAGCGRFRRMHDLRVGLVSHGGGGRDRPLRLLPDLPMTTDSPTPSRDQTQQDQHAPRTDRGRHHDRHHSPGGFSRRRFLGSAAAAPPARRSRRCGGGKSAQDAAGGGKSTGEFTGSYDGPAVTLSYWNGFTGGDGPFMKQMVARVHEGEPEDQGQGQHRRVGATTTSGCPRRCTAGKGPDVGVMHLDQLATNAARKVDRARRRPRRGARPRRGRLHRGGLEGRHLQGRALRHPARRALAGACTTTPTSSTKAGVDERADRRGVLRGRARQAKPPATPTAVLDADAAGRRT